jgi:hypothetical protein
VSTPEGRVGVLPVRRLEVLRFRRIGLSRFRGGAVERGRLALNFLRVSTGLFVTTIAALEVWHALGRPLGAVPWSWLWSSYMATLVPVALLAWPARGRPGELRLLLRSTSAVLTLYLLLYAQRDRWFYPAAALGALSLLSGLAMPKAEPGRGEPGRGEPSGGQRHQPVGLVEQGALGQAGGGEGGQRGGGQQHVHDDDLVTDGG